MIPDKPTRDFVITNCVVRSTWAAVRIGPESFLDMRAATVSSSVVRGFGHGAVNLLQYRDGPGHPAVLRDTQLSTL
jgi:hypothetical protein